MNRCKLNLIITTVLSLVLGSFTAPDAEAVTRIGWSAEQAAAWQHLYSTNHPYWQDLKAQADHPSIYNDDGLRDGMVYLITGNTAYANSAWNHVSYYRGRTYNTNGLKPDRNMTRDRFLSMARLFSWVGDGLSAQNKANFRDVLDYWCDLAFSSSHGTRAWDSDEVTGHYFGLVTYALALTDEDPARKNELLNKTGLPYTDSVGGVDATGSNYSSWRNVIKNFAGKADGGQWMESAVYNLNSARYMIYGIAGINDFYGEDKFPEYADVMQDFADAMVEELTPDLKDSFQWGDVQSANMRNLSHYNRLGLMSAIAGVTDDPQAQYVLEYLYNQYSSTPEGHVFPFLSAQRAASAPSGVTSHNANGRGLAYFHAGWGQYDSFFGSAMFNEINVDHERESVANFNLYRNGSWAVTNPRGYYGNYLEAPYMNGMLINGGVAMAKEARGQAAYEAGNNYMYHVGLTGGMVIKAEYDDPPLEFINEYSRSHLYIHHQDGSDSVFIFDRVKSEDPRTAMSGWKFGRFSDLIQNRVNGANGKHQWIMHMPEVPTINGDLISWVSEGGETVQLKNFDSNYTTAVYDEQAHHNAGGPLYLGGYMTNNELKYQFRLIPNQKDGFLTLMNVIHVGNPINATELAAQSGDDARGVYLKAGGENVAVIFNGTEGVDITPTPCCDPAHNYLSKHDPERFNNINDLRKFKNGFSMTMTSSGHTEVYLVDLDPAEGWKANVNGLEIDLTVSSQGVARFNYNESGSHSFSVYKTGVSNQAPVAVMANPQISGQTVTFDGSGSFDPEGVALTFDWDFGDGQSSTQQNPVHTYASAGQYTVTLTVSDGTFSGQDTQVVQVGDVNVAPTMNAIGDRTVKDGETLNFTVNAFDANGDTLVLDARLGNGDPVSNLGASFTDNGNGTGDFSFSPVPADIGSYLISFSAADAEYSVEETIMLTVQSSTSTSETHTFEVEDGTITAPMQVAADVNASNSAFVYVPDGYGNYFNSPSNITATLNVNINQPGDYVVWARLRTPSNNGSDDSFWFQMDNGTNHLWDTTISSNWVWDQVASRNGADPVIFNLTSGNHTMKIKLREDGTQIDKIVITNDMSYIGSDTPPPPDPNQAPTAVLNVQSVSDLTVDLTGSGSSDPDGDTLTYAWDFGDGNTSTAVAPSHIYASAGSYTVTLTVDDGEFSDTVSTGVTVVEPNAAPNAVLNLISQSDLDVQLNASGSSDPDGDTITYVWDLGDGNTATTSSVAHTYAAGGSYVVTLTVSDGSLTDTAQLVLSVNEPNQAPTAVLNVSGTLNLGADFNGASSSDPDGDALSYAWDFGDGNTSTAVSPTHTYTAGGTYTVSLTVNDGDLSDTDTVNVTVSEPQNTENHWLNAEFPSNMNNPMVVISGGADATDAYVLAPNGSGNYYNSPGSGMVSYNVNIAEAGEYILWLRTIAPSTADDSFFIQINNGTDHIFDVPLSGSFAWNEMVSRTSGGQAVIFNLQAGQNTIRVKHREDGTILDKLLLTNDMAYQPTGEGEQGENVLQFEEIQLNASSAQLSGSMQFGTDASGKVFAESPNGSGNYFNSPPSSHMATFTVTVNQGGSYKLFVETLATKGSEDSFWVQIDNGQDQLWDTPRDNSWTYNVVTDRSGPNNGTVFNLTPGTHTIKIKLREDGTKFSRIMLTNNPDL